MTSKTITYTTYVTQSEIFSHEDWDTTISGALLMSFRDMKRRVEVGNFVMDLTTLKIATEWGHTEGLEGPTFNLYMSVEANDYQPIDTETTQW